MVGPVEIKIVGTGADLWTVITYVRGLFQLVTELGRKVRTVKRAAFGTAFPAEGITSLIAADPLFFTVLIVLAFRTFALGLILKMWDAEKMPADLLGNGRRILIDPAGDLGKIFTPADTKFNGSTVSEGQVFFVASSFCRHK